ncbi:MAG TPA: hypothetical protein VK453_19425 [Micromonosporaceae bacterium]|nr:hypothetical protein [Micromonosporaceae bacterium]
MVNAQAHPGAQAGRFPLDVASDRGAGRGGFIDSVLAAVDHFYQQVIQNLKPWMPAPPKLRSSDEPLALYDVAPSLVSTAISSQDGPTLSGGADQPAERRHDVEPVQEEQPEPSPAEVPAGALADG